jgi:3-methyladenine DNA glycosylase/8-oxoguanine DNA glycosylase
MSPLGRRWSPGYPVSFALLLGLHRRGGGDPTHSLGRDGAFWRTARTPEGATTLRLVRAGDDVEAQAWGPGAGWLLHHLPDWLGASDDLSGFRPQHRVLVDGARRLAGPRVGRTGLVMEALIPAILEQKVTGGESRRGWARLMRRHGDPAPGPAAGLVVFPEPATWCSIPSWDWHRAGVGPARAATCVRAATVAARLEQIVDMPTDEADARLRAVPGVGAWTSAEVRARALGDADAVSVADAHVPRMITYALTGEVSDSDERMLAALRPYEGHRFRVQRILERVGVATPRFGPKYSPHDFRRM